MKIVLVTAFPPGRGDLNEYGYHLACALRERRQIDLTILADETSSGQELSGFHIERCWRFNSFFNLARVLRAVSKAGPDVVWFNMGFSTFARTPLAAFLSVLLPGLIRLMGFYTHVTLHTVFERINLKDAGLRWHVLYRMAGHIATRMLLYADDVSVLLPSYREELLRNYRVGPSRVHFRPHGTFGLAGRMAPKPEGRDEATILAFGYWGTYKRLELLRKAMDVVLAKFPNAILLIAGKDHPNATGYLESLERSWRHDQRVQFLGYVPEDELDALFCRATVLVLPYSSAAGASGVVHQGCEYGLPMVASDVPEVREAAVEEGAAINFYAPGDVRGLTEQLLRLLGSAESRGDLAARNLAVARSMRLSNIAEDYLDLFEKRLQKSKRQAIWQSVKYQ